MFVSLFPPPFRFQTFARKGFDPPQVWAVLASLVGKAGVDRFPSTRLYQEIVACRIMAQLDAGWACRCFKFIVSLEAG
jgi:hypothetical protein